MRRATRNEPAGNSEMISHSASLTRSAQHAINFAVHWDDPDLAPPAAIGEQVEPARHVQQTQHGFPSSGHTRDGVLPSRALSARIFQVIPLTVPSKIARNPALQTRTLPRQAARRR